MRTILDINELSRDEPLYLVGYPEVMEAVSRCLKSNYYFNVRAEVDAFSDRPNHLYNNYTPSFRYFMKRYSGDGTLLLCTRDYAALEARIAEYGDFHRLNLWRYYRDVARVPGPPSWKTITDYCLSPGSVVFDVGANNGVVTRHFAERAHRVYAFEPNMDLAGVFRANTAGCDNVMLYAETLSDRVGEHDFHIYEPPGSAAYGSSMEERAGYLEKRRVPMTTIDEFCVAEDVVPDFIKIDTEGHEPEVIAGAERIISEFAPAILFEYCEDTWDELASTMRALSKQYGLYRLDDGCRALDYYECLAAASDATPRAHVEAVTNILCLARSVPRRLSDARGRGAASKDAAYGDPGRRARNTWAV
ncbi:MAG: FkbM family methyltransferase [Myxococcota bacterium]|jgi:FkbM family methyltransferase|nr:FkbM family methyltransferase [Myxococcota bacterium]